MKLPRWLVIAMLTTSVLSVLAAAGCWWVTWPERTAREFVELIATEKFEAAQAMMGQEEIVWTAERGCSVPVRSSSKWGDVEAKPRSLMNLLACTGQYGIPHAAYNDYPDHRDSWLEWTFTARRGKIVESWWFVLWVDVQEQDNGDTEISFWKDQRPGGRW